MRGRPRGGSSLARRSHWTRTGGTAHMHAPATLSEHISAPQSYPRVTGTSIGVVVQYEHWMWFLLTNIHTCFSFSLPQIDWCQVCRHFVFFFSFSSFVVFFCLWPWERRWWGVFRDYREDKEESRKEDCAKGCQEGQGTQIPRRRAAGECARWFSYPMAGKMTREAVRKKATGFFRLQRRWQRREEQERKWWGLMHQWKKRKWRSQKPEWHKNTNENNAMNAIT